jgi:peptidoglycan hydrolase-like protein with peptidoglycan-binding domain
MPYRNHIQRLIDDGSVASILKRGSGNKDDIRALQNMLHELGFGSELNWEKYGADGDYGGSTVNAVATFSQKNDLAGDGDTVTPEIAKAIIARYDILDDMRYLKNAIQGYKV